MINLIYRTRCTTNILDEYEEYPPSPNFPMSLSVSESSVLTDSLDFEESPLLTEELACGQSTPTTSQKKRKRQENDADGEFREVCKMYKDLWKERAAQNVVTPFVHLGK